MPRLPLWILIFACGGLSASAQDSTGYPKITWGGYIKNLSGILISSPGAGARGMNLVHNRLNFKAAFGNNLSARLEIRNRVFYGGWVKASPDFGTAINQYPGYFNLSKTWVSRDAWVLHSVIDRLLLQYQGSSWDIKAGRQRINWGLNTIWNPNDLFNAFNFLDFDYEERPGLDALRIQHFLSGSGSLELAWKPGRHRDEHIAALMGKFNLHSTDFQVMAGLYQADWVLGGGWAGALGSTGFKGEFSYFHPRKKNADHGGSWSASLMADRTFNPGWYLAFSALYNGSPALAGNPAAILLSQPLSAKSLFPSRWAFYFGATQTVSPVLSLQYTAVYGLRSSLLVLAPACTWNAARNLDLDLILQSFFSSPNATLQHQATAAYLRGRWSF